MNDLTTAEKVCTKREYHAYKLRAYGWTQQNIALGMGISRARIRFLLDNANRKIAAARKEEAA